jgi:pimeloyl-ACP methyl ester carboxylesterase
VRWGEVLEAAETRLIESLEHGGPLDWKPLRMFVLQALADAIAYRRSPPTGWDSYHQIHWEVYRALGDLRDALPSPASPLVMIGHSLGSVIASDHIWDEQKRQGFGRDPFTRCETLAGVITFGSAIPLFTLGLKDIRCIRLPPASECPSGALAAPAQWMNYYDRDDVLGHPLRTLSPSFARTVTIDVETNAGGALISWNPLSHNGYWSEPKVVEGVAQQLARILTACDAAETGISAAPDIAAG